MLILGIKGGSGWHHSAVALVDTEQERILFAAEEERYNNIKATSDFPVGAIAGALRHCGVTRHDIDVVAFPMQPELLPEGSGSRLILLRMKDYLETEFPRAEVRFVEHHKAHAASAFYCSGFEKAAVMTLDGCGEKATATFGWGAPLGLVRLAQVNWPDSLGMFYLLMSQYIGLSGPTAEGNLMALAAYKDPEFLSVMRKMLTVDRATLTFRLNEPWVQRDPIAVMSALSDEIGPKMPDGDNQAFGDRHCAIAASVQARLEEVVCELARGLHDRTDCDSLCLAGGVALNCVANQRILEETPFERIFIQPAANDAGTALGAALAVKHSGRKARTVFTDAYLGEDAGSSDVQIPSVARLLADGKIVGVCRGRAEFGPRALGHRSILCSASDPLVKVRLTEDIKHRLWFRPYAPMVTWHAAGRLFGLMDESPYMLLAPKARLAGKLAAPNCIHIDGTARVQEVRPSDDGWLDALLYQHLEATGSPVLLNTSLNLDGEAIVNTVEDARDLFRQVPIDALVAGPFFWRRDELPLEPIPHADYIERRRQRFRDWHGDELAKVERALA